MGSVQTLHNRCCSVTELKSAYGCNVFVETGCYQGNSLSFVMQLGFNHVYSCDLLEANVKRCLERFNNDPSLTIRNELSTNFLERLLPDFAGEGSLMFWLDAHLPDVRIGQKFDLPLEEELEIINRHRPSRKDVILIDDLRIYEDGPFTGGLWNRTAYSDLSLGFLDKYGYDVKRFYEEEGYIVLTR